MSDKATCRQGESSLTLGPELQPQVEHASMTWVIERKALVKYYSTTFYSENFSTSQDTQGHWFIQLETRPEDFPKSEDALPPLRMPKKVDVHLYRFGTAVYGKVELRTYEEATTVVEKNVKQSLEAVFAYSHTPPTSSGIKIYSEFVNAVRIGSIDVAESAPNLTLRIDIAYIDATAKERPCTTVRVPRVARSPLVPPSSLDEDFKALAVDDKTTDVVLVHGSGKEWRAHKAVLVARSPVFAAMFKHDMAECKSGRVNLEDVTEDAVHQVLRFIYTDEVDAERPLGVDTLAAADRYQLPGLKALCEEELIKALSVDNAVGVLAAANLYRAEELQEAALRYISCCIHKVMDSPTWAQLDLDLMRLVLAKCVNYSKKPSKD